MTGINEVLIQIRALRPIQAFFNDYNNHIWLSLLLFTLISPWWLDLILRLNWGSQRFSLSQLGKFSPEAKAAVRHLCRKQKIAIPELRLIPNEAPILFSYGTLPRFARLVVSRGLLNHLGDEEIAALVSRELAQIAHGNLLGISGVMAVLQLPYTLYLQSSRLGDWLGDRACKSSQHVLGILYQTGVWLSVAIGSLSYGPLQTLALSHLSPLPSLSQLRRSPGPGPQRPSQRPNPRFPLPSRSHWPASGPASRIQSPLRKLGSLNPFGRSAHSSFRTTLTARSPGNRLLLATQKSLRLLAQSQPDAPPPRATPLSLPPLRRILANLPPFSTGPTPPQSNPILAPPAYFACKERPFSPRRSVLP